MSRKKQQVRLNELYICTAKKGCNILQEKCHFRTHEIILSAEIPA
jgi:hypothetical protein